MNVVRISLVEARITLSEVTRAAKHEGIVYVITKNGTDTCAVISTHDLDHFQRLLAKEKSQANGG